MSPIFSYTCPSGHKFDKLLTKYTEKLQVCPECKKKAEQVHAVPAKRDPRHGITR